MQKSNEMQIGKAGEYLVCADLILKGFIAFPSEQGLPYDVLLDNGKRLLKVQVKTTTGCRVVPQRAKQSKMYIFNIKRHGVGNKKTYENHEVNLFALVCLDVMKIAYITPDVMPSTINIRSDELRGIHYDEKGIKDYENVMREIKAGLNQSETARKLNLAVATVNRMCAKDFKPHKTQARYLSDFERDKEWIAQL